MVIENALCNVAQIVVRSVASETARARAEVAVASSASAQFVERGGPAMVFAQYLQLMKNPSASAQPVPSISYKSYVSYAYCVSCVFLYIYFSCFL